MSENRIAIVLASGDAERMNGAKKQLLNIGGTTILGRILSQMEQYKQRAILVTHNEEIAQSHDRVHDPQARDTVCDTLLSTSHLWDDRTIVLLGDVVYSNDVMHIIMNCTDDIRVFGNTWEIFAVVFDKTKHSSVKKALRKGRVHRRGKLRYFYRSYIGVDLDCEEIEATPLEYTVFFYTRDWTRDVDSEYEYERLMNEVIYTGLIDV